MKYTREAKLDYIHSLSFFLVGSGIYDNAPIRFLSRFLKWCLISDGMGGGSQEKYDVQEGGGGIGKADVCGQGEGGGPKSRKFCGRHLSMAPYQICN